MKIASQVMIHKVVSLPRAAITEEIGRCNNVELEAAESALRR